MKKVRTADIGQSSNMRPTKYKECIIPTILICGIISMGFSSFNKADKPLVCEMCHFEVLMMVTMNIF